MINAAPGEILDFTLVKEDAKSEDDEVMEKLTARKKKKLRQAMQAFKEKLNQDLEKKIEFQKTQSCPLPPRYDDIFLKGFKSSIRKQKLKSKKANI